ncbi:hypothetical protein PFISCL1PPCAC_17369 [Pristionchus fissidentatus]|uniref:Uncharacterized protein n=1 Tax=Pristionchus fissidentatus TaxID=1538716 RepID=A0AAV5W4Z5_9BILA|nr:hypothetical protein PFISCL1PPCAC_17369 [Pristionchus fissidentatus]
MASSAVIYHDEPARQNHRHGSRSRSTYVQARSGPRVRVITQGEETIIQCTDSPVSPAKSLHEEGSGMVYLDDIALLQRGYINRSSVRTRNSPQATPASEPIKSQDSPISLAELESRGLLINGKVVYTVPRGTKYSKNSESKRATRVEESSSGSSYSSTSRSFDSGSDHSSVASVATLVNDSKKPTIPTGDLRRMPDGTVVEKFDLKKGGVRYQLETNERITTIQKNKRGGSVIFSTLKGQ